MSRKTCEARRKDDVVAPISYISMLTCCYDHKPRDFLVYNEHFCPLLRDYMWTGRFLSGGSGYSLRVKLGLKRPWRRQLLLFFQPSESPCLLFCSTFGNARRGQPDGHVCGLWGKLGRTQHRTETANWAGIRPGKLCYSDHTADESKGTSSWQDNQRGSTVPICFLN